MRSRPLSIAFAFLLLFAQAIPCCVAMRPGASVLLSDENVVIVWDKARGIEHFVRQAKFTGNQKDFGFIVPTPTEPELALADSKVSEMLEAQIPKPKERHDETLSMAAPTKALGKVEVIRTQTVGHYDATVVRATDGNALGGWLAKNGYATRPAMEVWLDSYAKRNWIFTAFKFTGTDPKAGTMTEAIRVSFKTDKPHYPYKMPKDTWPPNWYRPMNVYFVSSSPMKGVYEGSDSKWEAEVRYAGSLGNGAVDELAGELKLKREDMPAHATMTVFKNGDNPDGYAFDLNFEPRPSYLWAAWLLGGAASILILIKVRMRRMSLARA